MEMVSTLVFVQAWQVFNGAGCEAQSECPYSYPFRSLFLWKCRLDLCLNVGVAEFVLTLRYQRLLGCCKAHSHRGKETYAAVEGRPEVARVEI